MSKPKKRKRARVVVGKDENGKDIIKWAGAYTKRDLEAEKYRIRKEWEDAHKTDIEKAHELLPAAQAPESQGTLFGEYLQSWYDLYKKPHLRATSCLMYENIIKTHLKPAFGSTPINAIRADDIQRFILGYDEASSSIIDKIMMTLRQVFAAAFEDDLVAKNPMNKVKPPEGTKKERTPISLADVDTLTEAAKSHPDGLMPLLMVYTGLRRGEVLGLKWDDLHDGCVHVSRALVYEGNRVSVVGETKTEAAHRKIPMLPVLAEQIGKASGSGYVFGGNRPMPYTTFKRRWKKLQDDIPVLQGVSPHRLRHTYLMLLRRAGVDPATQQYLMGHSDYETTANTYTHIDAADTADALEKMVENLPELLPHIRAAKG